MEEKHIKWSHHGTRLTLTRFISVLTLLLFAGCITGIFSLVSASDQSEQEFSQKYPEHLMNAAPSRAAENGFRLPTLRYQSILINNKY